MAPALASAELEPDELLDDELELILADGDGLAIGIPAGVGEIKTGVNIGVETGKGEPIAPGPTIGDSMEVSVTV